MALYRKYRPASFAEVVGQEQVTGPLSVALDSGRINHAYLFSGPRGCGKTSSARIMARSLNCEQGPTSTPCGVCSSCVSLAPGGPGNLDVTELDAASYRGVDDMRELRDRAYYAPAESRYRVFIIDEAHMITTEGSNALLKIVEEPPEHLIFIFATTEPEKVIGTIRSRTHHYPFRLLTPQAMRGLLQRTCEAEGVQVDESVFPLVIRAGGGSPRDSLSILDQLLAGAGPEGLTYESALPLLGVTDITLIDSAINALATRDAAELFRTVDNVIEAGHDPRRFVTDLLERLRDLMILQAVPDAFDMGLVDAPADRAEELRAEAARFSTGALAQLADAVNERISDMRGATSPRLLLEILCAHLLIGGAPQVVGPPSAPMNAPAAQADYVRPSERARAIAAAASQKSEPVVSGGAGAEVPAAAGEKAERVVSAGAGQKAEPEASAGAGAGQKTEPVVSAGAGQMAEEPRAPQPQEPKEVKAPPQEPETADLATAIRQKWSDLRAQIGEKNKVAEIMLTEAVVLAVEDGALVLGHNTGALAERINASSNNIPILAVLREHFEAITAVRCVIGREIPPGKAEAPAPAESSTWGQPKAIPTAEPAPVPEEKEEQPIPPTPTWAEKAARGQAALAEKTTFDDGVPLPPDPEEDYPAPPVEDSYVPEPEESLAEEELIREAASGPGELDHRDALTIAMELVESELGARRL